MKIFFATFVFAALLLSCGQNNTSKTDTHTWSAEDTNFVHELEHYYTEDTIITNDSVQKSGNEISAPCAIIVTPTIKRIDSLKRAIGKDFYIIADDNEFYIGTARSFLDSSQTKTIDLECNGQVKFKQKTGALSTIQLSDFSWGIILFNGNDKPIKPDVTNFEAEFKNYMKK